MLSQSTVIEQKTNAILYHGMKQLYIIIGVFQVNYEDSLFFGIVPGFWPYKKCALNPHPVVKKILTHVEMRGPCGPR